MNAATFFYDLYDILDNTLSDFVLYCFVFFFSIVAHHVHLFKMYLPILMISDFLGLPSLHTSKYNIWPYVCLLFQIGPGKTVCIQIREVPRGAV